MRHGLSPEKLRSEIGSLIESLSPFIHLKGIIMFKKLNNACNNFAAKQPILFLITCALVGVVVGKTADMVVKSK